MLKRSLVAIALSVVTVFVLAAESDAREAAKQVVELQDGSTLYVFKDGKMAVADKGGKATSTPPGTSLRTKDGRTITMVGNAVAYLDSLLTLGMRY